MINLLSKIFAANEFFIDNRIMDPGNGFFAERNTENYFDYFLVVFESISDFNLSEFKEQIDVYKDEILTGYEGLLGLDKNLSLLVVLNIDGESELSKISNIIYDLEEDPYDFKKYVLPYGREQLDILTKNTNNINEPDQLINYMRRILHNSETFTMFKNNENNEATLEYDLVSKYFIKLPFLTIVYGDRDVRNLEEEIRGNLDVTKLNLLDELTFDSSTDQLDIDELYEVIKEGDS
ncbi:ABC-three component system middle component 1 [Pseudalkalibacillus hwajinpoensis]|uniref:ABC-three component system middle component 1 n=1 Tax=Guptibacillus hwajinpoensis TaxID=208199 RepID=UPI00325AA02D